MNYNFIVINILFTALIIFTGCSHQSRIKTNIIYNPKSQGLNIQLSVNQPLKLVKDEFEIDDKVETGKKVFLQGELVINIKNNSKNTMQLINWGTHNLVFINKDSRQEKVVIHPCECFGLFEMQGYLIPKNINSIEPGKSKKITMKNWRCDGIWVPPQPGKYEVIYRTLQLKQIESRITKISDENRLLIIKECTKLLHSQAFWKEASTSNSLNIKLKEPVEN